MTEKVRLTVQLHNKNYFIGLPQSEFESIEVAIRPNQVIPSNYASIYRDSFNKNKKLAWVIQNIDEPYCHEFKGIYQTFKKLADVLALAAKIYSENCEAYKKDKVRRGEKALKRPRSASPSSSTTVSTDESTAFKNLNNAIIREKFNNDASDTLATIETLVRSNAAGIETFYSQANQDLTFAKNVANITSTKDIPLYKLKAVGLLAVLRSAVYDVTENDIN
jgi:hypothetical protein